MNLDEMEKDGIELPSDDELRRISTLAKRQLQIEEAIAQTEESLAALQKELDQIRDKDLSELLLSHGLSELKLSTGQKVTVSKMVMASISKDRADDCFSWLESHGFGALIKRAMEIDAGKGGEEKIEKLIAAAKKIGLDARPKNSVHPQTLKAFAKEQLEKAADFPMDLFGVFMINRTKIQ